MVSKLGEVWSTTFQSSPAWPIFDWRSLFKWDKTNLSVCGELVCQNGNMQWPAMMIVDRGKIKGTNDPNNGPKWLLLATHELFIRRATKASPSSAGCEPLIWTILNYTQMTTSHRLKGYFEYTLSQHTRIQNTNTGKTMLWINKKGIYDISIIKAQCNVDLMVKTEEEPLKEIWSNLSNLHMA